MEQCLLSFVVIIILLTQKKKTRVQIEENSELNGYLDPLFLFLVFVPI